MRRQGNLKEDYFLWLYGLIGKQHRTYFKLCRLLHQKKFTWTVHNDDNRYEDGLNLRRGFVETHDLDEAHLEVEYFLKGECTVFEMLIALAQRINDLMYDLNNHQDKTPKWFYDMLLNLGLSIYIDSYNLGLDFDNVTESKIEEKVSVFLSRQYDYYGQGGLFPLKRRPPSDQARQEIWYQLMLYLDENYGA
jgi:hypothetical protein